MIILDLFLFFEITFSLLFYACTLYVHQSALHKRTMQVEAAKLRFNKGFRDIPPICLSPKSPHPNERTEFIIY